MDLAYVDKTAKHRNGVINYLVCRDLFDRILDANDGKKSPKNLFEAFEPMITRNVDRKNLR